jgi:hypothetical protein
MSNAAKEAIQRAMRAVREADPGRAQNAIRDPFVPPGTHQALIAEVSADFDVPEGAREPNQKIWLRSLLLESTNSAITGEIVAVTMFDLARQPQYPGQSSEADRWALTLQQLTQLPPGEELERFTYDLLFERAQDQLLRGVSCRIEAAFTRAESGVEYREAAYGHQEYTIRRGKKEETVTRWVNVAFYPGAPQSDAELAEARKYLDEHFPIRERVKREARDTARQSSRREQDAEPQRGRSFLGGGGRDPSANAPTGPEPAPRRAGGFLGRR